MHPDILRELISQRGRELQEQAHRAATARTASRARRAMRRGSAGPDEAGDIAASALAVFPAIPDYVDGSFRTGGDEASVCVPPARRAA
jgi:hypothetical protein